MRLFFFMDFCRLLVLSMTFSWVNTAIKITTNSQSHHKNDGKSLFFSVDALDIKKFSRQQT